MARLRSAPCLPAHGFLGFYLIVLFPNSPTLRWWITSTLAHWSFSSSLLSVLRSSSFCFCLFNSAHVIQLPLTRTLVLTHYSITLVYYFALSYVSFCYPCFLWCRTDCWVEDTLMISTPMSLSCLAGIDIRSDTWWRSSVGSTWAWGSQCPSPDFPLSWWLTPQHKQQHFG